MLKTCLFIVLCLIVKYVEAENETFVYTREMAKKCKEHLCQNGYTYENYYKVDSDAYKLPRGNNNTIFELHLGIQAPSNGHILLSPVFKPGVDDQVYEFVIGGTNNQVTDLRGKLERNGLIRMKTPKILSSFEIRGFYIRISRGGLIELGKEGEDLPFLTYNDLTPLDIKYFSFAAWRGVVAKFLYDCPIPSRNGTVPSPNSKEIEPPLSISEQLKRSRLINRLPWISPKPTMDVKLGVKITSVKYDAFHSKLATAMSVVISWKDDSMAWYPEEYNGTELLKFRQGQIWRPKFYVFNSDNSVVFNAKSTDLISMVYSGEATFHFQTKVYTWCDFPEGSSKWPHDEYTCSIIIQPWEVHEKINIDIIEPSDSKMHIFSDLDDVIDNEWDVTKEQEIIQPTVWYTMFISDDYQTDQSDRLVISVQLKRRATAYNIVFYTPLIVLISFVLMSFWSEPLALSRIWFLAGCTIVISMGLCYIDNLVPTHTIPSILVLYTTVLMAVLLAMFIQALQITAAMDKLRNTATMQAILTAHIFRTIFCLPSYLRSEKKKGCLLEEEEDPIVDGVKQMESENLRTFGDKKELAEVIDRILFVTYSITFAVMLAAHF